LAAVKTNVYVDGFNLYYGAVKGTPHKWLNIRKMCELTFPRNEIAEIHYCTAIVKDAPWDPEQSTRQQMFIRALETTGIHVYHGSFISKKVRMPRAQRLPGQGRMVEVIKTEEKGSDVALGALLVAHGYQGRYDAAIVLSNDSDLVLPIRIVRQELRLPVGILNPHPRFSVELSQEAAFRKQIRTGVLAAAQFPQALTDARGTTHQAGRMVTVAAMAAIFVRSRSVVFWRPRQIHGTMRLTCT
jgi:hypothetical protein